jgi:hypothetical protein
MKQGWEILPFENCIKKVKYTAKIASSDYLTTGAYPIISQEEEMISGYWDNKDDVFAVSSPVVIFGDHTRVLKYVDFDFVLGADGVKILQPIDCLDAKFLMYFLKSYKIPSLGYSRHYKLLKEISVPVPERAEQERIVGELDCLSGIIAAKRAQLRELDTLAQSIFYTMFGDPITNDKGWQTKKWESVYETKLGKMLDAKKQNDNDIVCPYIANVNVKWGRFDLENLKTMTFSLKEIELYKLQKGDLLICEGGEAGRCAIWDKSDSNILYQKAIHRSRVKNQDINSYYTLYFLYNFRKHGGLKDYLSKSTIEHLTREKLNTLRLPIPPIALQNEFAKKIEQIETQKLLIKQSIINLEQLFNSRMYYYFE